MKIALISDVHANLEALEGVLMSIAQEGVDLIINLGDLVGYNADPNECVELIRCRQILSVAGNHDLAVSNPIQAQDFNIIAYQAIMWSIDQIEADNLHFLKNLPATLIIDNRFLACHGTPTSADAYISFPFQSRRIFNLIRRQLNPVQICFFGHTHKRALWYRDVRGKVALLPLKPGKIYLNQDCLYLINPGSVGQPRNHNPAASYALFDTQDYSVQFKLVPYDIKKTQRKILAAKLHPYLAERLAQGV
ncbi:MAG: metallophosphoesterase family protein [Deltaproteobacteria bacterium]|nr:metallophosphoesterase family protein [Deltaproteobacteria bacterium]MBW1953147.1 metallophosphoesterase family protein [Deltaproteobacteria bacterium]MBW1987026.1 metallophosphoesterase family protein [Deltaproteobacteria bacterium]MBW2134017.1 metallophosphoesterase family protein [Deltaproteobacteria bacterium]